MQFITHRDPVEQSGWSTALGATGEAVNNLLGIYSNYKNQQLEQKRYDTEQARRQEEFNLRKQEMEREAQRQQTQDALTARRLEEEMATKGLPGSRPSEKIGERTVDAAPDFKVDSKKPDAATPFGSAPDLKLGASPLAGMVSDQFKLNLTQPTRTEDVVGPAAVRQGSIDSVTVGGKVIPGYNYDIKYQDELRAEQEAAQHRKSMDIEYSKLSPEQRAAIQRLSPASAGLFEAQGWVPASVVDNILTAETRAKKPEGREVGGDYYEQDETGKWVKTISGYHATTGGKGGSDEAKPLLAGEIAKVQDFRSGLAQLSALLDEVAGTGTTEWAKTKIPNIMTEAFGWGADAKSRQAALDTAKQIIGKAMEGGVLRKEDEAKYMKILPTIKDAPEVARNKIQRIVTLMIRDSQMYLDTLGAAGRDVEDVRGLVSQSARDALVATGQTRPDAAGGGGRDPWGLLDDKEKTLGAPQANNAFGLPRVRVVHPPATRR